MPKRRHPLKKVVGCADCSSAAWKPFIGFVGADELYCTERGAAVEAGDGCTFGAHGLPRVAVVRQDVDIGDHAAVHGDGQQDE